MTTPLSREQLTRLRAGQRVELSGVVYTARDAAHQRLLASLQAGQELPIPLEGQVIYYCGPAPAPAGRPVGSAGPTTAARMDEAAIVLHSHGLAATIGKGNRSRELRRALVRWRAVYFVAVGGAGALLAQRVRSAELVAYPELGPEAIYRFEVEDFPLIVGYDCHGGTAFAGEQPLEAEP